MPKRLSPLPFTNAVLQRRLESVWDHFATRKRSKRARWDFGFHMTDWQDDLAALSALYLDPSRVPPKKARQIVYAFLIHAVPHLNEAFRLLEGKDTPNPFEPSRRSSSRRLRRRPPTVSRKTRARRAST
jgi:hypothetical protein